MQRPKRRSEGPSNVAFLELMGPQGEGQDDLDEQSGVRS